MANLAAFGEFVDDAGVSEHGAAASGVRLAVDSPEQGSATSGRLVVAGWAFHSGGERIVEVTARVGSRSAVLPLNVWRPDVADALGEPDADWSGFEGTLEIEESDAESAARLLVRAATENGEAVEVDVALRVLPSGQPALEIERVKWREDWLELEGWLCWPESSPPRRVALRFGEQRLVEAVPNLSRPDVERRFQDAAPGTCRGFRLAAAAEALAIAPRARFELRVVATDGDGRTIERRTQVDRGTAAGESETRRKAVQGFVDALVDASDPTPRALAVLDWDAGLERSALPEEVAVARPPALAAAELPYLDGSFDLVVVGGESAARVGEARRVAALATIEGATLRWRSPAPPRSNLPPTSIVVAAEGSATEACLEALCETLPSEYRGEILVMSQGGAELAAGARAPWRDRGLGVRVLQSEGAGGLARELRRAAELATGEVVVFLAGGTKPRAGWLPPLQRLVTSDSSVGAVGGKLLRADGILEQAGGSFLADGSAVSYGRGDRLAYRPSYEFVREVDFCGSALLCARRATLLESGGLDASGSNTDAGVDLCRRLRRRGWRVLYQPESVGVVPSTPDESGDPPLSRERDVSAPRRRTRGLPWRRGAARKRTAAKEHPAARSLAAPAGARRVLICAPRLPIYDRESGARRAFHLVDLMQRYGWEVSFLAANAVDGGRYVRLLQQRGVAVYAGPDSIRAGDEYVDDLDGLIAEGRFDLAIVGFWNLGEKLLPRFRRLSPATRVIVDSVDLHYRREERAAQRAWGELEPLERRRRRLDRQRRELEVYAAADAVLTVSEEEAVAAAEAIVDRAPVVCVPDMEELSFARDGFDSRSGLLFVGNFDHPPNLEGLSFFCREVVPRLDRELLAAHPLSVVGHGAAEQVGAVVASVPAAKLVGWVPSVVPYLERARVSVVSLLHGAGTKRKLLQALMVGTPSVSTSIGVEGLGLEHERSVLVADSPLQFAGEIRRLASDPVLWSRLAREGRRQVERAHSRPAVAARLASAIARAFS